MQVVYVDGHGTQESLISAVVGPVIDVNNYQAPVIVSNAGQPLVKLTYANQNQIATVVAESHSAKSIVYQIAGGADHSNFTINALTGELFFVDTPNLYKPSDVDANNIYEVVVNAVDEFGGIAAQSFLIQVNAIAIETSSIINYWINTTTSSLNTNTQTSTSNLVQSTSGVSSSVATSPSSQDSQSTRSSPETESSRTATAFSIYDSYC